MMMTGRVNGKISIVVPVYNTKHYLRGCITSIIEQSYPYWEAILVDDGSTDGSGELCDLFAAQDQRITVIHQENQGVSVARNNAIHAASGDYIGFVDSDDRIEPTMFERLHELAAEHKTADIVACGYYLHREGKTAIYPSGQCPSGFLKQEDALIALLQKDYYRGFLWNKLFRASLFSKGSLFFLNPDISVCEDLLAIFSFLVAGKTLYYEPQPMYHYFVRSNSLTQEGSVSRNSELEAWRLMERGSEAAGDRVQDLVKCRYSEAAVNLLYYAKKNKQQEQSSFYKREACRYSSLFYRNNDILTYEKLRMFCKLHFPILSVRALRLIRAVREPAVRQELE